MKFYQTFLTSLNHQITNKSSSTPNSPFKNLAYLTSSKIPICGTHDPRTELSYACGWARAKLPAPLGQLGLNPGLLPGGIMPVVGEGGYSEPKLLFHQGSLPGAMTSVMLLPGSETVILVLSNALALTDVADWVGQAVLEQVLYVPAHRGVDFLACARKAVAENLKWYPAVVRELAEKKREGAPPKELGEYVGT